MIAGDQTLAPAENGVRPPARETSQNPPPARKALPAPKNPNRCSAFLSTDVVEHLLERPVAETAGLPARQGFAASVHVAYATHPLLVGARRVYGRDLRAGSPVRNRTAGPLHLRLR